MNDDSTLQSIERNIQMLTGTWSETIDYRVEVNGEIEKRSVNRSYASLLVQLEQNITEPMQAGARGPSGPNKAGSRPPTNSRYADCLDTIQEQAFKLLCALDENTHPDAAKFPPYALLGILYSEVRTRCWDQPHECAKVAQGVDGMVRMARVLLGYETRIITLADTSCHKCGGTLVVAADASTDVLCLGCGHVYDRLMWIDLL